MDGFITTCFAEEGIRGKFLMSRLLRGGGAGAPAARGSNRMKLPPPPPVRGDPGAYQRDARGAEAVRTCAEIKLLTPSTRARLLTG